MSGLEPAACVAIELGCTRMEALRLLGREDAMSRLVGEISRDVQRYQDALIGSEWQPLVKILAGEGIDGEQPPLAKMIAASVLLEDIIRSLSNVDTIDDVIVTVYYLALNSLYLGDEPRSKQVAVAFKKCLGYKLFVGGLGNKPDELPLKPEELRGWLVV